MFVQRAGPMLGNDLLELEEGGMPLVLVLRVEVAACDVSCVCGCPGAF